MKQNFGNIKYALRNQWLWTRERVVLTFVRVPIAVIISFLTMYFPALIVSEMENGLNFTRIVITIAAYIGIWYLFNLFEKYRYSRSEKYRYYVENIYQLKLIEKHWRTDYEKTEDPNITQEYNIAYGDATGYCSPAEILNTVVDLLLSLLGIVTYSGVIVSFSIYFIIPVFVSAVVTYITGQYMIKYHEKHARDSEFYDRKVSYIRGCASDIKSAKEIRVFSLSDWFKRIFSVNIAESLKLNQKKRNVSFKINLINTSVLLLQNIFIYTVLTIRIVNKEITASDYVLLLGLVTGFSSWFIGIINDYNQLIGDAVTIQHYRNYLEMPDAITNENGKHIDGKYTVSPEITFENVGYQYLNAENKLYNDFNIKINSGEKIAIVGENGAGKTTLVKLLCGLYKPQSGDIYINDEPASQIDKTDYFNLFSVVFQDMYLLPIKIKEFVASADTNISDEKVIAALEKAGLYDKVKSLSDGIETPLMKGVQENGVDLSGGEIQKLMIARAFYKDAPILIFDEPSSALDPIAEKNLYGFINENTKDKTVIFISHRLASTKFCDRIVYLENGTIAESGSHDELMNKNGKYAELFRIQSKYYKSER